MKKVKIVTRKLPYGEPEEEGGGGDLLIGRPAGSSDPGGGDNKDHWLRKADLLGHMTRRR